MPPLAHPVFPGMPPSEPQPQHSQQNHNQQRQQHQHGFAHWWSPEEARRILAAAKPSLGLQLQSHPLGLRVHSVKSVSWFSKRQRTGCLAAFSSARRSAPTQTLASTTSCCQHSSHSATTAWGASAMLHQTVGIIALATHRSHGHFLPTP